MSNIKGFMTIVENIYFSADFQGNFDYKTYFLENIQFKMQNLKDLSFKDDIFIIPGVEVLPRGIGRYPYAFYVNDKVRIYFASNWTDNYPVYLIVSAQFLHTEKVSSVLEYCSSYIRKIVDYFFNKDDLLKFSYDLKFKLSRVDICNHTTKVKMNSYIKITEYFSRVSTRLGKVFPVVERSGQGSQIVPYFRYGKGDFCVRFYNKTKEVVEQKYKPFFIKKWFDVDLINDSTKRIYENVYKLGGNYLVDFLYSNILFSFDDPDDSILDIVRVYNSVDIESSDKVDILNQFIRSNKIKVVPEVTNIEFQLRSNFLKTIKIIDKDTGEFFDFCDMEVLFNNIDMLYHYLTNDLFRVVDRKSKSKRIRDKTTDLIWKEVQQCVVENVNLDIKIKSAEIYRQYNDNLNKFIAVRDSLKKVVHLEYLCNDNLSFKNVDSISIDDILKNVKSECSMNENYFNLTYLLSKQIKNYGVKGQVIEDCEKNYSSSVLPSNIDYDYVKNLIFDLKYNLK